MSLLEGLSSRKSRYPIGSFREIYFIEKNVEICTFLLTLRQFFSAFWSVNTLASCKQFFVGVAKTVFYTSQGTFSKIWFHLKTTTVFLSFSDIEGKNFNHLSSIYPALLSKLLSTCAWEQVEENSTVLRKF